MYVYSCSFKLQNANGTTDNMKKTLILNGPKMRGAYTTALVKVRLFV